MHRYALYFAPDRQSALWQAGCSWLGRDPEQNTALVPVSVPGLGPQTQQELTAEARRYGFHATLKPPFRLAENADPEMLSQATANLAERLARFETPPLILQDLDGFMALVLSAPSPAMQHLADAVVRDLDRFRAPSPAAELARRRKAGLSADEERRLLQWGYPYVMEGFRFHMTLTRRLTAAEREILQPELARRFLDCIGRPLAITDLCLYGEAEPGAAFQLLRRFPLGQDCPA